MVKNFRLVTVDGKVSFKDKMSLGEMQEFVGGYIEAYKDFYVNEDGLRLNLARNKMFPEFVGNVIQKVKK